MSRRLVGFARDLLVEARQKRGPIPDRTVIHASQLMWLEPPAMLDLKRAYPGAVLDLTPGWMDGIYGTTTPQRISMLRIIDCPACANTQRMTACSLCEGAKKMMHI